MTASRRLAAALVLVLVGCSADPTPPLATLTPSATDLATPTAAPSAVASMVIALPEPRRPYDAEDLIEAMRDTRRPDGVPAELQDPAIAGAVADQLWTIDGQPWDAVAASAACGGATCSLELSGGRTDIGGGEDVWVFAIDLATGAAEVVTADLHAVPQSTADALDRRARSLDAAGELDGLLLTAVRWLPPPTGGGFRLAYRSGNEEQSCAIDLELGPGAAKVTDVSRSGC